MVFSDSPGLGNFDEEIIFIRKLISTCDLLLFVVDDSIGMTTKEEEIF